MNKKKEYISPTLKLFSFQVETGFAGSGFLNMINFNDDELPGFDQNGMERWNWNSDNNEYDEISYFGGANDWD